MENNNNNQPQRNAVADWFREMFGMFVEWMEDHTGRPLNGVQAVLIALAAAVVGASTAVFAVWLVIQVAHMIGWVFGGQAGTDLGRLLSDLPIVHVATDPISSWMTQHAAGLPVSAATLLTVWAAGGAVLFVAGLLGARGARIAWPLYGAGTAAMAWFGAAEPHRPIAAGLIVLTWGLASILVLHRGGRRTGTHITNVLPARDRERAPLPSSDQPADVALVTPIR
ncbi:hypothetical protein [Amycolatopsis sp. NPDC051903]|uniref:hypothetical protein n=1 Tax=Amycolatopsis sp. NPDC051903 TaxID=3363936 RepID=UPI0037AF41BF